MLKTQHIVQDILFASQPELTALSRGVLNMSAYAKRIQHEVERRARKPVQVGTIVVALSRLAAEIEEEDPLLPEVRLDSLAVKSSLVEVTFSKTAENKARATKLYNDKQFANADFMTVTYGVGEISLFAPMPMLGVILQAFKPEKPKLCLPDLAALTVQFGTKYIDTPNIYFVLLESLAVRKINIVELISTYTELTFLVRQADLNELFVLMNSLMRQPAKRGRQKHG
jgi:hypothetical protein